MPKSKPTKTNDSTLVPLSRRHTRPSDSLFPPKPPISDRPSHHPTFDLPTGYGDLSTNASLTLQRKLKLEAKAAKGTPLTPEETLNLADDCMELASKFDFYLSRHEPEAPDLYLKAISLYETPDLLALPQTGDKLFKCYRALADIRVKQGDDEQAAVFCRKCISILPQTTPKWPGAEQLAPRDFYERFLNILLRLDRCEEYLTIADDYRRRRKQDATNPMSNLHRNLTALINIPWAKELANMGHLQEACVFYEIAADYWKAHKDDNGAVYEKNYCEYGDMLFRHDHPAEALEQYIKAVEAMEAAGYATLSFGVRYLYGTCLKCFRIMSKLGRDEEAIQMYNRVLALIEPKELDAWSLSVLLQAYVLAIDFHTDRGHPDEANAIREKMRLLLQKVDQQDRQRALDFIATEQEKERQKREEILTAQAAPETEELLSKRVSTLQCSAESLDALNHPLDSLRLNTEVIRIRRSLPPTPENLRHLLDATVLDLQLNMDLSPTLTPPIRASLTHLFSQLTQK